MFVVLCGVCSVSWLSYVVDRMNKLNQHKLWEQAHGPEGALYLQRKQAELQEFKQVCNIFACNRHN
jgi:hypothetical protein